MNMHGLLMGPLPNPLAIRKVISTCTDRYSEYVGKRYIPSAIGSASDGAVRPLSFTGENSRCRSFDFVLVGPLSHSSIMFKSATARLPWAPIFQHQAGSCSRQILPRAFSTRAAASISTTSTSTLSQIKFYTPSHTFQPFFTPSFRSLTTAAFDASQASQAPVAPGINSPSATPAGEAGSKEAAEAQTRTFPKSMPDWLFGCSALVFGILVVGGLTRLTESGLSIVEWNPITGILPPITAEDWAAEWEKYKVSPEGVLCVHLSVLTICC